MISGTPERLQKQIKEALEYTTKKCRVTANVKKCAVVSCNEDKVNPVELSWKWGEDELPIVDQYTYLGVDVSKDRSWDTHIEKVAGLGNAHLGNIDAILTDSHLDTRIKRCILMPVIVPEPEYAGELGREREVRTPVGTTTNDSSRKKYQDAQVRLVIQQHQEQNWECTHSKQTGTRESSKGNIKYQGMEHAKKEIASHS